MSALPIAHAGHWFAGLLYLAPVAILAGGLWIQSVRDKRKDRAKQESMEKRRKS
jgi:hypothetical protein